MYNEMCHARLILVVSVYYKPLLNVKLKLKLRIFFKTAYCIKLSYYIK
jgi:hypothetical protein